MIECRLIENESEESITPYQMSDNYFSLFKGEKIEIKIKYDIKKAKNIKWKNRSKRMEC